MKPVLIKAKNIGPFKNLKYRFPKGKGKTYFIKGENHDKGFSSNGAGKSMLFDIVVWTLFDETYRGVSKDAMLRNDRKKGKCKHGYAIFVFKKDKTLYYVRRDRGNTNKVEVGIVEKQNSKMKYIPLKCGHRKKDVEQKINEILGINFEMFCSIAYLGGYSRFLQSTGGQRLQLLVHILGAGLLEAKEIEEKVKREWKDINQKITDLKAKIEVYTDEIGEVDIVKKEKERKRLKREVRKKEKQLASIQKDVKLIEKVERFEDRKEQLEIEHKSFKRNFNDLKERKDVLISSRKEIEAKIPKMEKEVESKKSVIEDFKDVQKQLEGCRKEKETINDQIRDLDIEISKFDAEIERIDNLLDSDETECPYCYSKLDGERATNKLKEKKKSQEEKKRRRELKKGKLKEQLDKNSSSKFKIEKKILKLEDEKSEYTEMVSNLKSLKKEYTGYKENIGSLESVLGNSKKLLDDNTKQLKNCKGKLKKIEEKVDKIVDNAGVLKEKADDLDTFIHNTSLEIDRIEMTIDKIRRLRTKREAVEKALKKTDKQVNIVQWCLFNIPKIKGEIINSIRNSFVDKTNEYLDQIYPDVMVDYDIVVGDKKREKFDINIVTKANGVMEKYEQKSGGEKKRISLAVILALNWLASKLNNLEFDFLMLDEVFSNVDAVGGESLVTLLQEEKSNKNLFVITHTENVERYGEIITVVKKNGISKIRRSNGENI